MKAITQTSVLLMIGGLVTWLMTKSVESSTVHSISFVIFLVGLSGIVITLVFIAPYMVYKRDTDALKAEIERLKRSKGKEAEL